MESKKINNNSSEVIIIDCTEDGPCKKRKRHHKRKCEHKRRKKLEESQDNKTDLKIIQNVEVSKAAISCIINVNTNITECKNNKRKCKKKQRKEHDKKYTNNFKNSPKVKLHNVCKQQNQDYCRERIVPTCSRPNCQGYIDNRTKLNKEKDRNPKLLRCYHRHRSNRKPSEHNKKSKCGASRKTLHKHNPHRSRMLSPISSSPFKDDIICLSSDNLNQSPWYEDVSPESFRYSDNELDTLIKRTKERERRLQEISNQDVPLPYTSTPLNGHETISDGETATVFSGTMDISIHSLATLVLEPPTNANYSPLSSIHDWTGIELQDTSGYSYQNHQNLVQHVGFGKSGLPENNNEQLFPNYSHRKRTNTNSEGRLDNLLCAPSSPLPTPGLETDITKSGYNFSEMRPIKLENSSYSPLKYSDVTSYPEHNLKRENSHDYLTSVLSTNNNDYYNIPDYPVKLEYPETTDINSPLGTKANNFNSYPDYFSVKSETTGTINHFNM